MVKIQEFTYFNTVDEVTQRNLALRAMPIRTTRGKKKPKPTENTPESEEPMDFGNLCAGIQAMTSVPK
jgi:hypothetical protein